MAAKYITISHKTKQGNTKEIKYRVDSDFVPAKVSDICNEFIENYCFDKDQEDWLYEEYSKKEKRKKKVKNDDGTTSEILVDQDISFITLRSDFVNQFFPDIIVGSGKKKTNKQRFLERYNKKHHK